MAKWLWATTGCHTLDYWLVQTSLYWGLVLICWMDIDTRHNTMWVKIQHKYTYEYKLKYKYICLQILIEKQASYTGTLMPDARRQNTSISAEQNVIFCCWWKYIRYRQCVPWILIHVLKGVSYNIFIEWHFQQQQKHCFIFSPENLYSYFLFLFTPAMQELYCR